MGLQRCPAHSVRDLVADKQPGNLSAHKFTTSLKRNKWLCDRGMSSAGRLWAKNTHQGRSLIIILLSSVHKDTLQDVSLATPISEVSAVKYRPSLSYKLNREDVRHNTFYTSGDVK